MWASSCRSPASSTGLFRATSACWHSASPRSSTRRSSRCGIARASTPALWRPAPWTTTPRTPMNASALCGRRGRASRSRSACA
eukprot:6674976-Prymnesium_polylepis.1